MNTVQSPIQNTSVQKSDGDRKHVQHKQQGLAPSSIRFVHSAAVCGDPPTYTPLVPQEGNAMEIALSKFITPHQTHVGALIMSLHELMKYSDQKIEERFVDLEKESTNPW